MKKFLYVMMLLGSMFGAAPAHAVDGCKGERAKVWEAERAIFVGQRHRWLPHFCPLSFTAIYTGLVAPMQARRADEMQAVADALSLLANVVMAWNTAQMQAVLDRWSNRRQVVPTELLGRIAPTRLEGINLRGVFRFPVERYAGQLMPSQTAAKTSSSS